MIDEKKLYDEILTRLLSDQHSDTNESRYGEFGKTRSADERDKYQIDSLSKPEMFMTLNAIQTLILLEPEKAKENIIIARKFVERRVGPTGFLEVNENISKSYSYTPIGENIIHYKSYRHTIAVALIFLILKCRFDLTKNILTLLLNNNIQNDDGGWPIANKIEHYKQSDLWTSGYAIQFLILCLKSGRFDSNLIKHIKMTLEKTYAYFLQKEKNGYWFYKNDNESERLDITSHLYIELFPALNYFKSNLLYLIPSNLANYVKKDVLLSIDIDDRNEIYRLGCRLAMCFKYALTLEHKFLEPYWILRQSLLSSYSNDINMTTYDICCLLILLKDTIIGKKVRIYSFWKKYGWLSDHIPWGVGEFIEITRNLIEIKKIN